MMMRAAGLEAEDLNLLIWSQTRVFVCIKVNNEIVQFRKAFKCSCFSEYCCQ